MSNWIFIDEKFYTRMNAKISVFDHGLLYGDGIYEGIRCYSGNVFQLEEHIDRMMKSANSIRMKIKYSKQELIKFVIQTLNKNKLKNAYIRIIITRGFGPLGPDPNACENPSLIIITENLPNIHGDKAFKNGVSLAIVTTRRDSVDGTSHEIKSLNYLNSISALIEAKQQNADDAVMLDQFGFVSESTVSNIFIVENGVISTPQTSNGILKGITRRNVIEIAKELNIQVLERNITPYELINADEIFLTGTHAEVLIVKKINNIIIENNELSRKIQLKYIDRTTNSKFGIRVC
ncbi:branched-chain-amino-acid transaminase [Staphylococcus pseudintermedius]|uniref:branched-chain-amino-acid transaminase n=1 Tax=Staphylococcus pseudintermedius TaxID=283734 RepID=UPI000BBBA667|nr:branched-chain-amino-acid transaminase [Staphylococcus pseudintermedius]EGQ1278640.1 branched-chain-amino-acid transaminase [Staphylococcus pseudintermedius]EHT3688598.1 branched-chain-amino-acid transaminase [Staphylococcus pseudintermedius]EHT7652794.1 branched-chain-amino-acid transaminase [Staphylococcus pseudintermedius]EIE3606609.1 branched-chain-amino-acid transaminase [Staphylococcus pseudintermedius]EJD5712407.1 branched-chain-amino-acid transaminase [Staphylococcus pseudintermediu